MKMVGNRSVRRLLAGASVLLLATAPHVDATNVVGGACTATVTWTFSPPLTRTVSSGTMTQTAVGACSVAIASSSPANVSTSTGEVSSNVVLPYVGNCELALIDLSVFGEGLQLLLIGGTLAVGEGVGASTAFGGAWVVQPDEVCNERVATGAGVAIGTFTN